MKLAGTFVTLALAILLLAPNAAPAAGSPTAKVPRQAKVRKTKPRVKVLTRTQLNVVTSGKVKAKVWIPSPKKSSLKRMSKKARKKARKAKQRIKLSLSVTQSFGGKVRLKPIRIKARPYRGKIVKLPINVKAARLIEDCGVPSLNLTARGLRNHRYGTWKRTTKRKLTKFDAACAVPPDVDLSKAKACDFIAPPGNACMAPFPNDFYTVADSSTETGRKVQIAPAATPVNVEDVPIAVTDINRSDGFSPGPLVSIRIPGMETKQAFDQSGIVPVTNMSKAYAPEQAVVLIDADTGERQLIWGELDAQATTDAARNLIIRPGENLTDGHRYIVALRNLKKADGTTIEAPAGFRLYRDTTRTDNPVVEKRREHFNSIFDTLGGAGIDRHSLYLAWDFTVASTENITGRMLSIRDRGFATLGDTNLLDGNGQTDGNAPDFQLNPNDGDPLNGPDGIIDFPTATGNGVENIRQVNGTFTVPCFLDKPGCPPTSVYNLDGNQIPIRTPGNTMTAKFRCNIPRSAVSDDGLGGFEVDHKVRPSLYGHGLFGSANEVNSTNIRQLGTENGVMTCGTDWSGMASEDVVSAAFPALLDLSKFSALPDRLQQGFLNFLFLGRLMIHEDGFTDNAAFQFGGESVIDTSDLFYYGNSQGGIAGGALTAVATDFTRSVLYVPGINYSMLLTRSKDFETYKSVLYPRYTNEVERPVMFSIMQMLWDRGEPNGYASHMTDDPLPGTPAHKVLLDMSYGDHQVANVATEVEARTIGAPLRRPVVDSNRLNPGFVDPFFGHDTLGDLAGPAADGNGYFVWDIGPKRVESNHLFGTDPAPLTNTPPITSEDESGDGSDGFGIDPHDTVIRSSPLIRKQIADFITTNGKITNPCGNNPCYAAGWMGMP